MSEVAIEVGASVGKAEQLLALVTRKRDRPNWQAVRRQMRRERKLIRTQGIGAPRC